MTSVTIPDSVTEIGSYAFRGCTALTSITIPGSVDTVEYDTFFGCTNLKKAVLSDGVTEIEYDAFGGCKKLASITIPSSVKTIGGAAFYQPLKMNIYGVKGSKAEEIANSWTGNAEDEYTFVEIPATPTTKAERVKTGVKVTWSKVKDARGYIIYRQVDDGKWTKIAKVDAKSKRSYIDKKAANKAGTGYTYMVKACKGGHTGLGKKSKTIIRLAAPKTVKAEGESSQKYDYNLCTVTWTKVAGAKGYIVYRKTKGEKKWTRVAKVFGGSNLKYNDYKVKKGGTYIYSVKAYNGGTCGSAGISKSVKVVQTD